MKRYITVLAIVLSATACVDADPLGLTRPAPQIAGTYAGTMSVSFTNIVELALDVAPITLTLENPGPAGDFAGNYAVASDGPSGDLAGTIQADGAVSVTQFGEPGQTLPESLDFIRQSFPWCDFSGVGTGLSGNFRDRQFNIDGTLEFPCYYTDGVDTFTIPTKIEFEVATQR